MIRFFCFFLITGLFAVCTPVRVVSTSSIAADFSGYKTFSFYEENSTTGLYLPDLKNAIEKELVSRGLEKSTTPDLHVNIGTTVEDRVQTRETDFRDIAYMGQRNYAWESQEVVVNEFREGTVVVDIVDSNTNELVWQGVAAGTVSGKQSQMVNRINKAIDELFSKFPLEEK